MPLTALAFIRAAEQRPAHARRPDAARVQLLPMGNLIMTNNNNGPLKLVLVVAAIGMIALHQASKSPDTSTATTPASAQAPTWDQSDAGDSGVGKRTATPPVTPAQSRFDEHRSDAAVKCQPKIEKEAYDFRWDGGGWFGGVYFTGWRERSDGKIDYAGDNLELQNGFGNWIRHTYSCTYDPSTSQITNVLVWRGRLSTKD